MSRLFVRLCWAMMCVAGGATGCGSDESGAEPQACVPNASVGCTGPGNCSGYQVCKVDGSGYTTCECGGAGGAAGSAGASGTAGSGGTGGAIDGGGSGGTSADSGGMGGGGTGGGDAGIGGAGTGGAGATAGVCAATCQKNVAAKCPNDPLYSVCYSKCVANLPGYQAVCGGQTSAWYTCFETTGTAACNTLGYWKLGGCFDEFVAFGSCTACVTSPGDSTCEACTRKQCCQEMQQVYATSQYASYLSCLSGCTSESCEAACYSSHQALGQALTKFVQCRSTKCGC